MKSVKIAGFSCTNFTNRCRRSNFLCV